MQAYDDSDGTRRMTAIGRYEVLGRLGEGAMADVYRAHDPGIGRVVAIKVLKPEYARNAEIGRRFLREARAAGALNHPHIATVHDVGEADGVAYLAMELIEGRPLDAVIEAQGRMPHEAVTKLEGGAIELVEVRRVLGDLGVQLRLALVELLDLPLDLLEFLLRGACVGRRLRPRGRRGRRR